MFDDDVIANIQRQHHNARQLLKGSVQWYSPVGNRGGGISSNRFNILGLNVAVVISWEVKEGSVSL